VQADSLALGFLAYRKRSATTTARDRLGGVVVAGLPAGQDRSEQPRRERIVRSDEGTDRDLHFSPWQFWEQAGEPARQRQREWQQALVEQRKYVLGERCFVSALAAVSNAELTLGDGSYVAAGAYLTGTLRAGRDCTVNPYAVVRGDVVFGDAVRVGAHSSILAFNHTMTDPDVEVFRQPLTTEGITVGDDVWIGSHVVILDGVTVGSRSVIAAGAVVTKDVPAGAVVAGNPARVLRWRVPALAPTGPDEDLAGAVAAWAERAREQAGTVLDRCFDPATGLFRDTPAAPATVRAQCDAIEVADLLLGLPPPQLPAADQAERLRGWQDETTGLIAELGADPPAPDHPGLFDPHTGYHVLSAGYALDLLGSAFAHPVRVLAEAGAGRIVAGLEAQPWQDNAWGAGHWVDIVGTAFHWNRRLGNPGRPGAFEALFGWLLSRVDPRTGMWGRPAADGSALQIVNGYYRATRGTFAQFGLPVPHASRVVDTVLAHARDPELFRPERQNACNVLDVAHPLWLTRTGGHRTEEVTDLARRLLRTAIGHWRDGAGFGFQAPHPTTAGLPATHPGLQGTEMWLAIIWLLADLAGVSAVVGYRPRGVHRPEPPPRQRRG
jgi:acetyltransferase-like isoleucine patch superfamily enzyme